MGAACGGCKSTASAVNSDVLLSCARLTPVEGETQLLKDYIAKVGTPSPGGQDLREDWIRCYAMAVLRVRRLMYSKGDFAGLYGSCGEPSGGSTGATALAAGTKGLSALSGAGTLGLVALPSILGPITFGIGLLALPFIAIFRHHAQAVQKEQTTLCDVTYAWNQFADAVEAALQQGKISLADARTQAGSLGSEIDSALAGISKTNPCNAGCGVRYAVKALVLYNQEVIYPSLVPGLLGGTAGKVGLGVLALGGGLLVAKAVL
jgi:hypothetical protein